MVMFFDWSYEDWSSVCTFPTPFSLSPAQFILLKPNFSFGCSVLATETVDFVPYILLRSPFNNIISVSFTLALCSAGWESEKVSLKERKKNDIN